jgi:predicted aspartyl protease
MTKNFYRLREVGNLMSLRVAFGNREGDSKTVRLLVDTGSSYTVLPTDLLEELGCDMRRPVQQVTIVTASGVIQVPMVLVPWLNCLGQRMENFPVLARALPFGTFTSGLLGMDILKRCDAVIYAKRAEIVVEVAQ